MSDLHANPNASGFSLEICANGFESALAAQNGGAQRVELCDNLAEGGTTSSYAQIALCTKRLQLEVWPIIRPRGGDFLYSDLEFDLMKEDIKICKSLNCKGVVIGILKTDGSIDKERCAELIELAKPMKVSFHRAFDMSNNLEQALEDLIELGVIRVLTSGGASSALLGAETLSKLIWKAEGRIAIMPGAGIKPGNLKALMELTGATDFHASAKEFVPSKMIFRNQSTKMGSIEDEYQYELSSESQIKKLTTILNS